VPSCRSHDSGAPDARGALLTRGVPGKPSAAEWTHLGRWPLLVRVPRGRLRSGLRTNSLSAGTGGSAGGVRRVEPFTSPRRGMEQVDSPAPWRELRGAGNQTTPSTSATRQVGGHLYCGWLAAILRFFILRARQPPASVQGCKRACIPCAFLKAILPSTAQQCYMQSASRSLSSVPACPARARRK